MYVCTFAIAAISAAVFAQQAINITGTIRDANGAGLANAKVGFASATNSTTTNASGAYSISGAVANNPWGNRASWTAEAPRLAKQLLYFGVGRDGEMVKVELYSLIGKRLFTALNRPLAKGNYQIRPYAMGLGSGLYCVVVQVGGERTFLKMPFVKNAAANSEGVQPMRVTGGVDKSASLMKTSAAAVDSIVVSASGYITGLKAIPSYQGVYDLRLEKAGMNPIGVSTTNFSPEEGLVKSVEKPYRQELCLNGSWDFLAGTVPSAGAGTTGPTSLPDPAANATWDAVKIKIPSCWNGNGYYKNTAGGDFVAFPSYPTSWESAKMVWMRRTFTIPAGWSQNQRIVLHFEGAIGGVQVKVNGTLAGPMVFNSLMPFEYDITSLINWTGTNTLLVAMASESAYNVPTDNSFGISAGPLGPHAYAAGSMWQERNSGLYQDVYLWSIPAVSMDNVFVKPLVESNTLEADITVKNNTSTSQNFTITSNVKPWNNLNSETDIIKGPEPNWSLGAAVLAPPQVSGTVAAGQSMVVKVVQPNIGTTLNFWTPDSPNLYGFVANLTAGSIQDCKYERFGWRSVKISGTKVYLNGSAAANVIQFRGDAWHANGIQELSRRYAWAWYKMAKAANCTSIRLHAMPRPRYYLEVADEVGIFILDETSIWGSGLGEAVNNPLTWPRFAAHVTSFVQRDRNHPCVLGWSLCNEMTWFANGWTQAQKNTYAANFQVLIDSMSHNDSTRTWRSADGDNDLYGKMPFIMNHYGADAVGANPYGGYPGSSTSANKPIGEGETGWGYFGKPSQFAPFVGNVVYRSYDDECEAAAIQGYLLDQGMRTNNLSYASVWNIVWYGLKPLPIGHHDIATPISSSDGVFYPNYVEGKPGVQPERVGPYTTTLNPGIDPTLPLYQPRSLYLAMQAANVPSGPQPCAWSQKTTTPAPPAFPAVKNLTVACVGSSVLTAFLTGIGLTYATSTTPTPQVLVTDGSDASAKAAITAVLGGGGRVIVLGATTADLATINQLLPDSLSFFNREASSVNRVDTNILVNYLSYPNMYCAEDSITTNQVIMSLAMGGNFVKKGRVLLTAGIDDLRKWINQDECIKTAAVLRSKYEGVYGPCLVEYKSGTGTIDVASLNISNTGKEVKNLVKTMFLAQGIATSALQ